jgi:hypothetical protein
MTLAMEQLEARIRERLAEQRRLVSELLAQREQLQGSLFERYALCGKPGCACRGGERHGPYYVLSTRGRQGSAFTYLPPGRVREARSQVRAGREFRRGLKRLQRLNQELVALLRRVQAGRLRASARDLRSLSAST